MTTETYLVAVAMLVMALVFTAYGVGKGNNRLAAMEARASSQIVSQEVSWEIARYRIQSLRMDWVSMAPSAQKTYIREFGRPSWAALHEIDVDPLKGVPLVTVRGSLHGL